MNTVVADISILDEILTIENESFSVPWSRKSFEDAFESDTVNIFALKDDNSHIVGFACVLTLDYEAELLNIAVKPCYRGCGYGRILMEFVEKYCSNHEISTIYLEVRESNISARTLYSRFGFVEIGVRKKYYTLPVEDAILMQKEFEN